MMKTLKLRYTGLDLYWLISAIGLTSVFIIYPVFSYLLPPNLVIFMILSILLTLISIILIQYNIKLVLFIIPLLILKVFFYLSLEPIITSDELNYYNYAVSFSNSQNMLDELANHFNKNIAVDLFAFVEPLIGYFYSSIIILSNSDNPYFIYIINLIIIIFSIGLYSSKLEFNNRIYLFLLAWIIFSPYLSYWGTRFFKDYISLLIIFYSLVLFINKKFFLFIILILLATSIRSYSIVIFAIYFLFWKKNIYITFICALVSFIISLFLYPGIITKYLKIFGYFLISPNPLKLDNYDLVMGTQIIEAVFIFLIFTYGLIKRRKFTFNVVFCISIYASCIYMVDNRLTYSWNLPADTITENYHRKKIPIFPMLMLASLNILFNNKKLIRKNNCELISNSRAQI
ncbi:hypothetical protein RGL88_003040 [Providencia rettgeri]|nr:hypothetical protein [Providencia rettgeri]